MQGVVAWYGIFNFATIAGQARTLGLQPTISHDGPKAPEWRMLGCVGSACGEQLAKASPASRITRSSPPMLLITGTGDRTVPAAQSIEMAQRLREAGVDYEILLLDDVDHSFIGASPEATTGATRRAVEATFRFIDRIARSGMP